MNIKRNIRKVKMKIISWVMKLWITILHWLQDKCILDRWHCLHICTHSTKKVDMFHHIWCQPIMVCHFILLQEFQCHHINISHAKDKHIMLRLTINNLLCLLHQIIYNNKSLAQRNSYNFWLTVLVGHHSNKNSKKRHKLTLLLQKNAPRKRIKKN